MDKGFNRAVTLSANVLNTSTILLFMLALKWIPKQVTSQKLKFIRTGFVCMCCRLNTGYSAHTIMGKTDGNK